MQDGYLDVDQRAAFFQVAYSSAPAMVMRTIGAGSKYPFTTRDADGDFLERLEGYRLHLPPDPPAALFWAVTAYNVTDGTMPETPQLLPSINGFNEVASNSDGSIDLWFGPEKPADAPNRTGSRPWTDATSSSRCASTAPASNSSTRPGSRRTWSR